jgi:hypothetical protein
MTCVCTSLPLNRPSAIDCATMGMMRPHAFDECPDVSPRAASRVACLGREAAGQSRRGERVVVPLTGSPSSRSGFVLRGANAVYDLTNVIGFRDERRDGGGLMRRQPTRSQEELERGKIRPDPFGELQTIH